MLNNVLAKYSSFHGLPTDGCTDLVFLPQNP